MSWGSGNSNSSLRNPDRIKYNLFQIAYPIGRSVPQSKPLPLALHQKMSICPDLLLLPPQCVILSTEAPHDS